MLKNELNISNTCLFQIFFISLPKKIGFMKKFGNIKVGDVVYYSIIKDSEIIQDCVGGIIMDGYVSNVVNNTATGLTINKMRYKLNEGYVKDEEKVCRLTERGTVFVPSDENLLVIDEGGNQYDGLFINKKIIISTSKKAIAEKLLEIISDNEKRIDEMTKLCSFAQRKSETMKTSALMRLNMVQYEEDERELTEEEFACIAL